MEKPFTKLNRGQISIPIAAALTGATFIISGLTSYFTSQMNTQSQVSNLSTVLSSDISMDRERIAKVEEAITSIKTSQQTTEKDIKEILRLVKN